MSTLTKHSAPTSKPAASPDGSTVVERNVRTLVEHAAEHARSKTTGERFASAISAFAGTMNFVYFHAVAFGLWAANDFGWLPRIRNFDPTFTKLGTAASVEAIFLATFVLISQNRLTRQEEVRNHLDVQVSLLNEHETTHILRLVTAISDRMGLDGSRHPEIQELVKDMKPQEMIDCITVESDAAQGEIRDEFAGG